MPGISRLTSSRAGVDPDARAAARIAGLAAAVIASLALLPAGASAEVRTAALDYGKAERVKTMPISRQAWSDPRSVMSLPPQRVGELIAGDRIEAAGDFEVTICLEPDPRHPGGGQPCIGRMYGYNPKIRAKLVLAPSEGATGPGQTLAISKTVGLECRQDHPVRNHHCVVSVPWSGIRIGDPADLPCGPGRCHINVVATAYHGQAGNGEQVVIGSSDDNKRIHQGLAMLSSARFRPAEDEPSKTWRGGPATKKLPVRSESQGPARKVIYSAKVSRLKAGDQLVVDARARTSIGHLPYNVFQRTEVVFAKTKSSTKPFGKVSDSTARVSSSSGFNCTQGPSGHSDVCTIQKGGVFTVKKKAKGPFYVNVVAGAHAIGIKPRTDKWRPGDAAKVQRAGGYVEVERYRGSCSTCPTGWTGFGPNNAPTGKPGVLVKQLAQFGIVQGAYNCSGRPDKSYRCKWRSAGRFGEGPKYRCESKATLSKSGRAFNVKVCKDQLASQLWHELLNQSQPIKPTFTGVCKELKSGDYRCKWFGELQRGANAGRGCKGFGVYKLPQHSWVIDPCRP